VADTFAPPLAPVRERRADRVTIVDGALVPARIIGWPRRARTIATLASTSRWRGSAGRRRGGCQGNRA
jgi:hypothetical protein